MAIRTISAAGGNWNSTATWVGGVIPTTSDSVLGDATSGQLTVNVNATVQYVDFTNYTQTLTINAGITFALSLASSTNTFGASMNFGGTGTLQLNSVASTWVQNTTNRIPNVRFTGSVTRTLSTDAYLGNVEYVNNPTFNGNIMYIGGDFKSLTSIATGLYGGTTNFVLDGSGIISAAVRSTITITGDYNTFATSLQLFNGSTLNYTTGATPTLFNILPFKQTTATDSITLNCSQPVNLFLYNKAVNSNFAYPNFTINLTSVFMPNMIGVYNESRTYTTDNAVPIYTFTGNSVSATTINMGPATRTTSSQTNPPPSGSLTYSALNLSFDPNYTHYIGNMELTGGGIPSNPVISSSQSGVQVPIILRSKITTQISKYDFTDVDASGGEEIVAINGTLTNTSNITNVYPTGGGGGGQTAYTFFS